MMGLNTRTIEDLRTRLVELQGEKERLQQSVTEVEREANAIKVLLNGCVTEGSDESDSSGFAAQVRQTLRTMGRVASPTEVVERMEADGFEWNGETKLSIVVNSELYRMAKSKKSPVTRVERGKYQWMG